MGLFTPAKKHPNRFNYTPRYYDPVKEAREQRRRELRGERGDDIDQAVADGNYQPGDYLRRRKAMRIERKTADDSKRKGGKSSMLLLVIVAALVLIAAYQIIPRVVSLMSGAQKTQIATEQGANSNATTTEEGEFNPYAPIVIVPNDYQE